jgi:PilZ domain
VSSSRASPERRRHVRAISDFSALLTAGQRQYAARVINLSMGGALLDCGRGQLPELIRLGDRVAVRIARRGDAAGLLIEGAAVLWHLGVAHAPLLAVQFDEVSGECAELLEDLIREARVERIGRDNVIEKNPSARRPSH